MGCSGVAPSKLDVFFLASVGREEMHCAVCICRRIEGTRITAVVVAAAMDRVAQYGFCRRIEGEADRRCRCRRRRRRDICCNACVLHGRLRGEQIASPSSSRPLPFRRRCSFHVSFRRGLLRCVARPLWFAPLFVCFCVAPMRFVASPCCFCCVSMSVRCFVPTRFVAERGRLGQFFGHIGCRFAVWVVLMSFVGHVGFGSGISLAALGTI